jgi:predicted nuclease of restriction endonuclease-like RecB superfamily
MLFSLPNVKRRSVRDPDGSMAVVPKLLHGRNILKLIEQAIAVFESYIGKPRSEYNPRALEDVLGDYRLGRCIEACLLTRYQFVQPQLSSILSSEQIDALAAQGLSTPSDMRLALWDAANTRYGGFVPPADREALLASLAAEWDLPANPALIDSLLSLDSDARAILTPAGDRPTPRELIRLYNRGAVKTLLAHSTQVRFDVGRLPGDVLKKLYFVAKRRGILVDIESGGEAGFSLNLFGPEQAFGTPDKYGARLADVALSLVRSILSSGADEVIGTAQLILHDRPYRFHLTQEILERLGYSPNAPTKTRVAESRAVYSVGSAVEETEQAPTPSFDSQVEARLYREYKSLEKQGYTHGWLVEREPEPLLAPGIVLIPDFAFLRGDIHVFMEIAGFWSPTYRERKVAKLRTLAAQPGEQTALVLAVPQDAGSTFADLPFPVLPYKTAVRATDVIALLDARYGQREQRQEAALSQTSALQDAVATRGLIPEQEIAETLQAYTRSELLEAARSLGGEDSRYIAGVGLLSEAAFLKTHDALAKALAVSSDHISLDDAAHIAATALDVASVDIEPLVQLWPEWHIDRPSLFEAYLATTS